MLNHPIYEFLDFLEHLNQRRFRRYPPSPSPSPAAPIFAKNFNSTKESIFTQEIKALLVVHKEKIMKFGEGIVAAPTRVEIDHKTGELTAPVEIIPVGSVALNPKIIDNMLINDGFIKVKVNIYIRDPKSGADESNCIVKEATIPIKSVHSIKGIYDDDQVQEKVKIKSITVSGVPDNYTPNSVGQKINLVIRTVLEVKLIIFREKVISVLCK